MVTFMEALYKSADKIQFGWDPEPVTGVKSYNIYVGQVAAPASLTPLVSNVSKQLSGDPQTYHKIAYTVQIEDIRAALGLASTLDFGNLLLYWALTYVDSTGATSPIADSVVVEVPPVGITGKSRREDPTTNRNIFGFSDEAQRWLKVQSSAGGAIIVDSCDYYKTNVISDYTYDGSNLSTIRTYFTDRTTAGSPAKLTTYSYGSYGITKIVITDSTV